MTLFEKARGKTEEVPDKVAHHLEGEKLAVDFQRPVAQGVKTRLNESKRTEGDCDHSQKIGIGAVQGLVDHKLDLERSGEGCDLQRHGKDQHLGERARRAFHPRP